MSVFDLPRLHFRGTAVVRLPTGPRSGLVDLATNTALTGDGRAFPAHRPAAEYHDSLDRLDRLDPRDRLGPGPGGAVRPAAAGPHSADTRSPATRSAATRSTTRGEDLSAKGEDFSGKGEDFSGNGHFSVDARIVSAESAAGDFDTADPVVGRRVDLWGHYNEYLATTVNRARVFDVDPASDWTTTLMVGRFCFGRAGRSHDVGYMATGDVHGFHPPRWHHPSAHGRRRSALHQFVVGGGDEGLTWLDETALSPAARRLRDTAAAGEFGGLVVQFALGHPSAPRAPGRPGRWLLRGTIAPWRPDEPRTYPAGRLLVPERPHTAHTAHATAAGRTAGLRPLTVGLTDDHVTLNMITAVPATVRAADGTTAEAALPGPAAEAALPVPVDLGDLELRTADSGRLVARVPRQAYTGAAYALASGVVTVPAELPASAVAEEALCLTGTGSGPYAPGTLLREKEINVQVDDASLILEHPRGPDDADHDVEVLVRSFVRGRPAAVGGIGVRQFFNPRALPRHPAARNPKARCADLDIVRLRAGRRDGTGTGSGDGSGNGDGAWSSACVLDTDRTGQGWFTLRGAAAGTARVLLSADAGDLPCDPDQPGSAALGYDHDDALGFWPGAGHLSLRVLPDDWRLSGTTPDEATFDLVHREVLACYEQLYSFMKEEVFSLADRCKVETYAKLIWQMCDPRNKAKTFYMPPTRDLSEPKARLLLTYLRARQSPERLVLTAPAEGGGRAGARARGGGADSRGRLVRLLRDAATLELAVMLQYLYAAYSVPVYGAGREYVRRGLWTPGQLRLACGDGGETLDEGIRGMLLTVAREEMVHFLLVGNILTAVGEPFAVPLVDFGTVNHELPLPLDLALERLGPGSVERFALIERPDDLVGEVRTSGMTGTEGMEGVKGGDGLPTGGSGPRTGGGGTRTYGGGGGTRTYANGGGARPYASLSELYADIREGLRSVPDLFPVDRGRGGGEHHLFLRESVDRRHPDYQMEVDDLSSALFAIDVITEQGEGGVLAPRGADTSHYASFLRIGELLRGAPGGAGAHPGGARGGPWNPAHPVVRNPTLRRGNGAMVTVTDPDARSVMGLFNRAYFMALQLMAQHFGERPDGSLRRSDLMNAAIDMMTGLMRPLAELLVTLPSGWPGTTAGPSFELDGRPAPVSRPDVARADIARRLDDLAADCREHPLVPGRVGGMSAFWADHFRPPAHG